MGNTVKSSIRFTNEIKEKLNTISEIDCRSQTQEISWLIEKRYKNILGDSQNKKTPARFMKGLREFKNSLVKKYGDVFYKLILYGSYAGGDYINESDVDLALLLNFADSGFLKKQHEFLAQADAEFFNKFGYLINTMVFNKEVFYERAEYVPYYSNILKEGIEL